MGSASSTKRKSSIASSSGQSVTYQNKSLRIPRLTSIASWHPRRSENTSTRRSRGTLKPPSAPSPSSRQPPELGPPLRADHVRAQCCEPPGQKCRGGPFANRFQQRHPFLLRVDGLHTHGVVKKLVAPDPSAPR